MVQNYNTRFLISLSQIDRDTLVWDIIETKEVDQSDNQKYLLVSMLNKFEKCEWLVQKCTELWMQHIVFFVSQYSQIREMPEKKIERLRKIALEATEQSYGSVVPSILFVTNIDEYINWSSVYILHQFWEEYKNYIDENANHKKVFLIWPEWWRWIDDEKYFSWFDHKKISLWQNILRTETAAIIASREALS